MAKKLIEVYVMRTDPYWWVYAEPRFVADIIKIGGVMQANWDEPMKVIVVRVDPRYDHDELEREIVELCR